MSNTATASNTSVSYTFKSGKGLPLIRNLRQDLEVTAALNEYRSVHGLVKARNPYSWWKYVFAALIAGPSSGQTITEARQLLHSKLGVDISAASSGLLSAAVRGKSPCKIRRQYSKNLPAVIDAININIIRRATPGKKGQPALVFQMKSRPAARRKLLAFFPELEPLIELLEKP